MFFRRRLALRYCSFGGQSYELTGYSPDCHVKEGSRAIATFETMSVNGNDLHIEHFAVAGSMRGRGMAETVLRGFARLVVEQAPQIDRITFDLHRASEGSDIVQLAQARFLLLDRIGARELRVYPPNRHCICVHGVWKKAHWIK